MVRTPRLHNNRIPSPPIMHLINLSFGARWDILTPQYCCVNTDRPAREDSANKEMYILKSHLGDKALI